MSKIKEEDSEDNMVGLKLWNIHSHVIQVRNMRLK
jgi:hypothetical protein